MVHDMACDRCGKKLGLTLDGFEDYILMEIEMGTDDIFDLCKECYNNFKNFLKNESKP